MLWHFGGWGVGIWLVSWLVLVWGFFVTHFAVANILSWFTFSLRQIKFHSSGIILISRAGKLVYSVLIIVCVRPGGD